MPSVSFSALAPLLKVQKPWLYHKLCFTQAVTKMSLLILSWVCSDWIFRAVYTLIPRSFWCDVYYLIVLVLAGIELIFFLVAG